MSEASTVYGAGIAISESPLGYCALCNAATYQFKLPHGLHVGETIVCVECLEKCLLYVIGQLNGSSKRPTGWVNAKNGKLSDLTQAQREHLAWRLDHCTAMGYITACAVARGDWGDLLVTEIFKTAGRSDRSARMQANRVFDWSID